jgi:hypothetical protein
MNNDGELPDEQERAHRLIRAQEILDIDDIDVMEEIDLI